MFADDTDFEVFAEAELVEEGDLVPLHERAQDARTAAWQRRRRLALLGERPRIAPRPIRPGDAATLGPPPGDPADPAPPPCDLLFAGGSLADRRPAPYTHHLVGHRTLNTGSAIRTPRGRYPGHEDVDVVRLLERDAFEVAGGRGANDDSMPLALDIQFGYRRASLRGRARMGEAGGGRA